MCVQGYVFIVYEDTYVQLVNLKKTRKAILQIIFSSNL